jgi:hypothetical protein
MSTDLTEKHVASIFRVEYVAQEASAKTDAKSPQADYRCGAHDLALFQWFPYLLTVKSFHFLNVQAVSGTRSESYSCGK